MPQSLQDKLTDNGRFEQGPRFIEWTDIENDGLYLDALAKMTKLFHSNDEFKADVLTCAESFMHGKIDENTTSDCERDSILMESKSYVLKEWASFQVLPQLVHKLVDDNDTIGELSLKNEPMVYLYHRRVPLLETFLQGKYTKDAPFQTLGHAVFGPNDEAHVNLYANYHDGA